MTALRKSSPGLATTGLRYRHALIVIAAALLPLLAVAPLVLVMSAQRAKGEAAVTADVVRRQLENIAQFSQSTLKMAAALTDRPCDQAEAELRRIGTLRPYLRGILLVRNHRVSCSILQGGIDLPLNHYRLPERLPDEQLVIPLSATTLVPDRPALLITYSLGQGNGALSTIDGQHILDMQAAAARGGMFDIDMRFGRDLQPIAQASPAGRAAPAPAYVQVSHSAAFPMEIRVAVAQSHLSRYRRELWIAYAPFLLLACALSGYGGHLLAGRKLSFRSEIVKGMRKQHFYMAYQPIVRLATGEFSGVEALLRWTHPHHGDIPPGLFIPVAEDSGLRSDLTRHIFALVAADIAAHGAAFPVRVGVNVSAPDLARPEFEQEVRQLLHQIGPAGPRLVLEITEREAVPDDDVARQTLQSLRRQDVLWALDDFGTGYSSLAYLEQLQPDFVKIDRIFVQGAGTESVNAVVLDAIIDLAHRLGLSLVAEGIENAVQRQALERRGVAHGQGFWFGRPMRARELAEWAARRQ